MARRVRRPVYDEICKTDYNIQAGISELKAYEQFGKKMRYERIYEACGIIAD